MSRRMHRTEEIVLWKTVIKRRNEKLQIPGSPNDGENEINCEIRGIMAPFGKNSVTNTLQMSFETRGEIAIAAIRGILPCLVEDFDFGAALKTENFRSETAFGVEYEKLYEPLWFMDL